MPTTKTQPTTAKRTASVKPADHQPAATPAAEPVRPIAGPRAVKESESSIELLTVRAELARALRDFDDDDILALWRLSKIVEADRGNSITPIEDFIVTLGSMYVGFRKGGHNLTPDHIASDLEECRHWFDMAVEITKKFNAEYTDIVAPPQPSQEKKVA